MNNKERILCAAVKYKGQIICGYRHSDCWATITFFDPEATPPNREDNGFLTSHKRFVDREEGYLIAKDNNQLLMKPKTNDKGEILTSECMYFNPENYFDI